jgi:hypothetical protein
MVGKETKTNPKLGRGKTTKTGDKCEGSYGRYKKGGSGLEVTSSL